MSEPFLLFVYGQLRSGGIGHRRLSLRSKTASLGKARVTGRLYDLGDYPGLILSARGIVHGELLAFTDRGLWRALDAYELCDPDRPSISDYARIEIDLLGSGLRAWTYVYRLPVKSHRVIASGRWTKR
jgi:gamma-glutamylcyclotransferase (GGCT)/AIG2-like uncharacterized protein YtfP